MMTLPGSNQLKLLVPEPTWEGLPVSEIEAEIRLWNAVIVHLMKDSTIIGQKILRIQLRLKGADHMRKLVVFNELCEAEYEAMDIQRYIRSSDFQNVCGYAGKDPEQCAEAVKSMLSGEVTVVGQEVS